MNWLDSDEAMSEKLLDIFEHSRLLAEGSSGRRI